MRSRAGETDAAGALLAHPHLSLHHLITSLKRWSGIFVPRTAVKGGEVGAVDTNWEGASGLEFLFLTRLNGGWLEAAEIIVCSMLVAHNETGAVSGGDGLAGKVLDLKGGSDWLTGTWRGIRESDTLGESGVGENGE